MALATTLCVSGRIWARYHNLLKMKVSKTSLLSFRKGTPPQLQPEMAPRTLPMQASKDKAVVATKEGAKVTPKVLRDSRALTQASGQDFLPAQPPRPRMAVLCVRFRMAP